LLYECHYLWPRLDVRFSITDLLEIEEIVLLLIMT